MIHEQTETPSTRKILILNQASNYLTIGFANAFRKRFGEVVLVTGSVHVQGEELHPGVKVHKINQWHERPARKKAVSYFVALIWMVWLMHTRYRSFEVVFVSVPPMGYLLNLLVPNRFSMVIWDVYPDLLKVKGMRESHWLYRAWGGLNKRSFRKAFRLFTISERMAGSLETYVPAEKIQVKPIWSIFQENSRVSSKENAFWREHALEGKFVVQYSGNIGLTHRVEAVVELAELLRDRSDILFQIIGRGPRKPVLEQLVRKKNLPNCCFLPFQSDEMFPSSLSVANLGVVILDEEAGKGSVPSKSYNLMSFGIPSLYIAGEDSQLKLYAEKYGHAGFFTPGALSEAAAWIVTLKENAAMQAVYSANALAASEDFKRKNADAFVEAYLHDSIR